MWFHPDKFEKKIPALQSRMALVKAVRSYYESQEFWEVETPALQVMPCADKHIHGFQTDLWGPDLKRKETLYLHTSPEFDMKKLLVAGAKNIYQLCHVYRNGESTKRHSPEFSLLEWYRAGGDYRDMMDDCQNLLRAGAENLGITHYTYGDFKADPFKDWLKISVAEAFERFAGLDLGKYLTDTPGFNAAIQAKGIRTADDDAWDDLFFRVMAEKIEPYLGMDVPAILYDYPADMACLSRKNPKDSRYAERFELYVCGVELANAFSELTDAAEQRRRFEAEMKDKQALYGFSYPVDEEFLQALDYGMPEAGGCALGFDRLVMLASGSDTIDNVLWAKKR
ncbi:MAG: EF-P lysine aminoacylase GenX [Alphaproteobacteria bacterium]|nr:EF-P lysine aminoacylase GenX [Alphaproteobacteria bacterium]MCD8570575.1 EF-P lysine aminoacylase GenX [Alphaproteobacteria bacterium]